MKDNDIKKAQDILEKLDFFGGQRAGRELWNDKPVDVQNKDIENFVKDIAFLKNLINRLEAENERLKKELLEQKLKNNMLYETSKEIEIKAYKEYAERLKENTREFGAAKGIQREVDNLLKEMVGEDNANII